MKKTLSLFLLCTSVLSIASESTIEVIAIDLETSSDITLEVELADRTGVISADKGAHVYCATDETTGVNRERMGGSLGFLSKFQVEGNQETATALCKEMGYSSGKTKIINHAPNSLRYTNTLRYNEDKNEFQLYGGIQRYHMSCMQCFN
ncbi:hypothetical protein HBN50_03470 [Halobacteriovorax sp. GB3]|uniref:hypothetical protein n=1 Tax=Halobacteriovorax sp. GB3 TaxID=2719615 RepID=UPI002360AF18|nr:hypothetical protein [Halobacteriovorax sp. GB3]MDD0852137.1 hypothetical protein [Halobacteriovorax sp. GB3]